MAKKADECKVTVMVRCRPMNSKEIDRGWGSVVDLDKGFCQINLTKPNSGEVPKTFGFDSVYGPDSLQQTVYDESAFPIVESVLEGYNGTIFAYGQTGWGKTHTMLGSYDSEETQGIIPKAFNHIFGWIDATDNGKKFLVRCSYLEIYNESILDLLGKESGNKKLDVKEDKDKGIYVKGLTSVIVKSIPEIEKTMVAGTKNRKVGETSMNKDSSRSHSIFTIYIETAEDGDDGNQRFRAGKLNLVDLAGSERQSKTNATGDRLKEAQKINLSLSALGNVISALVDGRSTHIPYRDSKLTRLLQDSLGGNTKTVMIAAVSPADYNYDETLSTLRYASRAKNIKNKPKINEDPKDALLRQYEDEIKMLKEALLKVSQGGGSAADTTALLHNLAKNFPGAGNGNLQESIENIVTDKNALMKPNHPSNSQRIADLERISKEKENMKGALAEKEKMLEMEAKQKEELQSIIKDMEQKLMTGSDGTQDKGKTKAKAYREFQLKLQKQKLKEKRLKDEQMKREEELMTNYQDLQEEVDGKSKIVNTLKKRYQAALSEIKDLEEEHQSEKADLLDAVRALERDLDFYKSVVDMVIKQEELYKIKAKSKFDSDNNKWTVPPFIFKAEEVSFPKLKMNRIKDLINNEKENNIVQFTGVASGPTSMNATANGNLTGNTKNVKKDGYGSSSQDSYDNTGDSENKHNDIQSPTNIQNNLHKKKFNSTSGASDFFTPDHAAAGPEIRKNISNTKEAVYDPKGVPMKQKTLKRAEIAAQLDKHHHVSSQQNKLPPSIRWVTADEDDDPSADFFSNWDTRYQRNPKAIAQLAPLMGGGKSNAYTLSTEPVEPRMSINDINFKKKSKLKPLRDGY